MTITETLTGAKSAKNNQRVLNADGKSLTIYQKIESAIKAEKREAITVLTATAQKDVTVLTPFYSLLQSVAISDKDDNKRINAIEKASDRTNEKVNRNLRVLGELEKGEHLTDVRINAYRLNLQKVMPNNFGSVFSLSNSEVINLIKTSAKQTAKNRDEASLQSEYVTLQKKTYQVTKAVNKMKADNFEDNRKKIEKDDANKAFTEANKKLSDKDFIYQFKLSQATKK